MSDKEVAKKLAKAISDVGGRAYYVGGCVRDSIMGIETKDIDIEIHGVGVEKLEEILDTVGERLQFGKSFGVYSIRGTSLDIALPRSEECIGKRHTDFKIDVNPYLGVEKAALRRDFTVNAIMQDVLTGEITDTYGGIGDIQGRVLRHVSDSTFAEDPLRVLRCAQFASRFGFDVADETVALCSSMDITALSSERIFEEMKKALLKSEKPSVFFRTLHRFGQLSFWFSELEALIGVPQNPRFHAEGDVFEHTMAVLDAAAGMRDRAKQPLPFMISALVHDFGKALTTEVIDGVIHAYRHETEGIPIIERFLHRITNEKKLIQYAKNMTENHMRPNMTAAQNASVKATNKMFDVSVEPYDLVLLSTADGMGSIAEIGYVSYESFLFERLSVYEEFMSRPYVTGEDLINNGYTPDKSFSKLLEYAHKLRLSGVEKKIALKQIKAYARELKGGK